ncbi:glycoside hydrolase family 15 protein [Pantoea sp. 1.19]|uniref:glycoside hydrolase family 15 protein n=1 Tax=Pantoea sp. 1.19 TaxID=1925589 RepID=UPI000949123B|nr:glycoside hydrolase family 15 protein [Pantoea sp. 1.19]
MSPVTRRIDDHGVIGDMRTCALIATDGTLDYLCWPNLDSPSLFTALLDDERAGYFALAPDWPDARRQQRYLPESNVLQTRWLSEHGVVELTDLMPVAADPDALPCVIRRVTAIVGEARLQLRCHPVADYARARPDTSQPDPGCVRFDFATDHAPSLALTATRPLTLEDAGASASFVLRAGEQAEFRLGAADDPRLRAHADDSLPRTLAWWQRWARQSHYRGRWREAVTRSALVLKLLTSRRHGSIAAAATFGLPETIGGERNWDYRAAWIRDASFSMYALMRLGYIDEASRFTQWVAGCVAHSHAGNSNLQIMYRLDGGTELHEISLPHLAGYAGSRPVRVGNDAWRQQQLDIYGELLDAIYLANKYGEAISARGWQHISQLTNWLCEHWQQSDAGIWEMRGEPQHFLHSRLMCWVAIDRALRLGEKRSLSLPRTRWEAARNAIREEIWQHFWCAEGGHFSATRHGRSLDASLLLMPLVRFVSATDPDWLSTLEAIERALVSDGRVLRYRQQDTPADALCGEEGHFVACSFWYVECLARAGRVDDAQQTFEKLLTFATPLGLYAEEWDARGYARGNFPQALSHLALISAAVFLDRKLSGEKSLWQP